jgi:ELWxxDGT repeat protein
VIAVIALASSSGASPSPAERSAARAHRVSSFQSPYYSQQRGAPVSLLALGPKVLYLAGEYGLRELWVSDGTAAGTTLLRDLCASPYCSVESWVSTGSFALLRVSGGSHDASRLWRSDGTAAGTFALTGPLPPSDLSDLVVAGPFAYFDVCEESICRVWSTDGTVGGTRRVDTSGPDATLFRVEPPQLVAWHDEVLFLVLGSLDWRRDHAGLWRASRRTGRLEEVRALPESGVAPTSLVAAGDRMFFLAGNNGRELWTSDGTATGTVALTDFRSPNAISECDGLIVRGDRVWFVADDGAHGLELWGSDGTPAGTRRATDFASRRPFGGLDDFELPLLANQTAWLDGKLVLASVATSGTPRLWTTTGAWQSTALLGGCPGGCPLVDPVIPMVGIGNRAAFFGFRSPGSRDSTFWVTDGTGAGTLELPIDVDASDSTGTVEIVSAGGRWFVVGDSLWVTDGTPAGTARLARTQTKEWSDGVPSLAAVPGSVFFTALNARGLWGLWQTAGAGAREVFTPPSETSNYLGPILGRAGDRVIFEGPHGFLGADAQSIEELPRDATGSVGSCGADSTESTPIGERAFVVERWRCTLSSGTNFWSSDGTTAGTSAIRLRDAVVRSNLVPWDDGERALFSSTGGLWTSDGTAAGTALLLPISSPPSLLVAGQGVVYFALWNAGSVRLWSSDGTSAGTAPFGPSWSAIEGNPVLLDGRLHVFARETADAPLALWTVDPADGSASSVSLPELGAQEPVALTAVAGRVWFAADSTRDGHELSWLWVSDGTASGTKRLPATLTRPTWDGIPVSMDRLPITPLGRAVYFVQSDATHGSELWRSDGTVAGTSIVADLAPGLADGAPRANPVAWRSRLWFAADDGVRGPELWSTDGTAPGTRPELDLDRGPAGSFPDDLTVAGDGLFFLADDGRTGRQLWALPSS